MSYGAVEVCVCGKCVWVSREKGGWATPHGFGRTELGSCPQAAGKLLRALWGKIRLLLWRKIRLL